MAPQQMVQWYSRSIARQAKLLFVLPCNPALQFFMEAKL